MGTKPFTSLQAAVNFSGENEGADTIELLTNIVLDSPVSVTDASAAVTITSANGQTYTVSGSYTGNNLLNVAGAHVILGDIVLNGSVGGSKVNRIVYMTNGGSLLVGDGATMQNGTLAVIADTGDVTVEEGAVVKDNASYSHKGYVGSAIIVFGDSDLLIKGGTFTGNHNPFYIGSSGHLQFVSGTVTGNTGWTFRGGATQYIIGNGGVDGSLMPSDPVLVIEDNLREDQDINGTVKDILLGIIDSNSYTIAVTGDLSVYSDMSIGCYSLGHELDVSVDRKMLTADHDISSYLSYFSSDVEGSMLVYDAPDGKSYTLEGGNLVEVDRFHVHEPNALWLSANTDPVARVGDTCFTTLQGAVDFAGANDTVYLLKNVTESITVLDKDGLTIRSESADDRKVIIGSVIVVDGEVTLNDIIIGSAVEGQQVTSIHVSVSSTDINNLGHLTIGSGTTIRDIRNTSYGGAESTHNVIGFNILANGSIERGIIDIEDGAVIENLTSNYGAIRVTNGSHLNVNGGLITGCTSTKNEGTVFYVNTNNTTMVQSVLTINNSEIKTVINQTQHLSCVSTVITIEYGESLTRVELVIRDNLDRIKAAIPQIVNGPYYKGITALSASSVDLVFMSDCKEEDYYIVQRAMNRELKLLFDENGINHPFPQVVVNQPQEFDRESMSAYQEWAAKRFVEKQAELSKDIEEQNN